MSVVQSTYANNIAKGLPGMPATETGWDIDTRNVETVAGIGFGLAVSQGAADRGVIIGGTTAGFRGVTVRDVTLQSSQADKYLDGQEAGVMVRGDIWVTAVAAVVAGGAVIFDGATGAFGVAAGETITKARWMTSAGAGGLAILRLNSAI